MAQIMSAEDFFGVGETPAARGPSLTSNPLPVNFVRQRSPDEVTTGNIEEIERELRRAPPAKARAILEQELAAEKGKPRSNAPTRPASSGVMSPEEFFGAASVNPAPAAKLPHDPILPSFGEPLRGPEGGRVSAGLLQRNTSEDWEPTPARTQTLAETPGGAVTGIARSGRRPAPSRSVGPAELAGTVVGSAAQISDMFTAIGKQVLGAAPYWGARAGARWSGATDKEAAEAGQAAKDKFFPPEISTPWARVAERLGGAAERAYYNNPVSFIFHGVGTAIEKGAEAAATENGMQKEDYLALADQLMGSLMWRGVRPKVQEAFRRRVDEARRGRPSGEPPFIDPPKALPGPDTGRGGAVERGAVIEGEFSRIPEPQRQAAISSASAWAKENALPAATASALAAWTVLGDRPEEGLIGLGLLGAMKGKGGMWHPKAVETVARPLATALDAGRGRVALTPEQQAGRVQQYREILVRNPNDLDAQRQLDQIEKGQVTDTWAKKASSTYLNRHMGTEGDPLKDIEIPFGEGTRRWGDITDSILVSDPAKTYRGEGSGPDWLSKAPDEEPIYRFGQPAAPVEGARIYSPGQASKALQSYLSHVGDFLRQNVAPEKLAQYDLVRAVRETAANDARVAKAMEREAAESSKDLPVYKDYGDGFRWVELKLPERLTEGQAKSVKTELELDPSMRLDPGEESMYFPVDSRGQVIQNSYTQAPASGKTPAEAHLAGQLAREGNQMGHCVGGYCEGVVSGESRIFSLRDAKGKSHVTVEVEPSQKGLLDKNDNVMGDADNIIQIKGKQNRAPVAEYQKYVQDFVKEGKWSEVNDLDNTGLVDLTREARVSRDPRYAAEHDQFIQDEFGSERFVTGEELARRWANWKGGGRERGGVDPKLAASLAAAGLGGLVGAWLDDDAPGRGALLGALAVMGASSLGSKAGRAAGKAAIDRAAAALDYGLGMVPTRIKNESPAIYRRLIENERSILKRKFDELAWSVPLIKKMDKLDAGGKAALDAAIATNTPAAIRPVMRQLGMEAEWNLIRGQMNGLGIKEYFPQPKPDATPAQNIYLAIDNAAELAGQKSLFGSNLTWRKGEAGKAFVDIDATIGNTLGQEVAAGRLTQASADKLDSLLRSRFKGAETAMPGWQQDIRNVTNAMLLGNPKSALTQVGDTIAAMGHDGVYSGIVGMARAMRPGSAPVNAREMGLLRHVADEIGTTPRKSAVFLDATLSMSTFRGVDQVGKNTNMNSALHAAQSLAQTPKGIARLRKDYEPMYEGDMPQLLDDLKNRRKTELTDGFAFLKLAERQPLTRLHSTQFLMDHPKVRILGQLKSFTLMQLDVARREVYQRLRHGDRAEGMKKAMKLAAAFGLAGMGVDAIKEWLFGNGDMSLVAGASEQILKTLGLSEYVRDKATSGDPVGAAIGIITPPVGRITADILQGKPEAAGYTPLAGPFLTNKEDRALKREERQRKEARAAGEEPKDLSNPAEQGKDRRRERTLERLERR